MVLHLLKVKSKFMNTRRHHEARKFAYAWYATDSYYLASAIIAMLYLKNELQQNTSTKQYTVDYVLVVYFEESFDHDNYEKLVTTWIKAGNYE